MGFSFVGTVECDRCGELKDESADECEKCADKELRRYHFERIGSDEIITVWAINPIRAWHEMVDECDDPRPFKLVETGMLALHYKQQGFDPTEI